MAKRAVPSAADRAFGEGVEAVFEQMGRFFTPESPLHATAATLGRRLDEAGIPYAIAGALALGAHGHPRATVDVDILITREGLERFKAEWLGRGYLEMRPRGRAVRETESGTRIDFLITGEYPGDGKPKPVAFPDPASAGVEAARFRVLSLPCFVELKLASGMTAPHRLRDLADVLDLIRSTGLPLELREQLDESVRAKYDELWRTAQHPPEDY